jgi:uncharacterized membrane protein YhhN
VTPIVIAVFAGLAFVLGESALGPLSPFVKTVPAGALAFLVWRKGRSTVTTLAVSGLATSALADLLIEFSFLAGLGAFLVAHLFYIAAFTATQPRFSGLRLLPFAAWAVLVLPVLASRAGSLALAVCLYGVVIFVMMWRAAAAVEGPRWNASVLGLVGAILFGVSDTLLGYSRFVASLPASNVLIMGTYWAAQALIATGFLRRRRDT